MGRQRKPAEIARDRRQVADLYLKGWLQVDIATELHVNQSTISRDLKALHREWLADALVDYSRAKARELAKIDRLEREYWVAWVRSCDDAETVTEKTRNVLQQQEDDEEVLVIEYPAEATKTRKGQAGDPRFLAGIQWCIERRCKILGVDAPTRQEYTGTDGGAILVKLTGNVGPDDL